MQATRPRVLLPPLQFGLGMQLYHHFASRFLIDSLHHHGFCCSYKEVHRFERNAAHSHVTDIPNLTTEFVQLTMSTTTFAHWMATAQSMACMGMIASVTPGTRSGQAIPRAKVTYLDVAMVGRVSQGRKRWDDSRDLPEACQSKGPQLLRKS